jgi:hypothetical protein
MERIKQLKVSITSMLLIGILFFYCINLVNGTIYSQYPANSYITTSDTNPSNVNDGNFDTYGTLGIASYYTVYKNYTFTPITFNYVNYTVFYTINYSKLNEFSNISINKFNAGCMAGVNNFVLLGQINLTNLVNDTYKTVNIPLTSTDCGGFSESYIQAKTVLMNVTNLPYLFLYYEDRLDFSGFLVYNNQNYNNLTFEGNNETFSLNISYDYDHFTNINASLFYNNTYYNSNLLNFGSYQILSTNLNVPLVSQTNTNKSFYWRIGLTNSSGTSFYNLSYGNQTIKKASPLTVSTTCPSGYNTSMNFTFFYEQNLTNVNITSLNYILTYGTDVNNILYSINSTVNNIGSLAICINSTINYFYIGYGELQYYAPSSVSRRYYTFTGTRITNQTVNIPVYNLESLSSTTFTITAQTSSLIPYTNHYVTLMRWYPSTNSYIVVDMGKTDSEGKTVLNIQEESVDYRLALYNRYGTLIKLEDPKRFICQVTPCTYNLIVNENPLDLTEFTGIQKSLTYDTTTNIFTFIWNDPSQSPQTMNLTVYHIGSISNTIVCSSTSTGYTGVLNCDVSGQTGTLKAQVVRTASPDITFIQKIISIRSTIIDAGGGNLGLFIGAILLILFAMIGSFSPVIVVILGIVSLIPLFLLGSINWAILMGIGVLGGVIIHFIRRSNG